MSQKTKPTRLPAQSHTKKDLEGLSEGACFVFLIHITYVLKQSQVLLFLVGSFTPPADRILELYQLGLVPASLINTFNCRKMAMRLRRRCVNEGLETKCPNVARLFASPMASQWRSLRQV